MIEGDRVRVTITVDVEPADAFTAFTEEIDLWWRRGVAYRRFGKNPSTLVLETKMGGRLFEQYGDEVREAGRVTIYDPPKRVAFEWRGANFAPDERTEVDVTFTRTPSGRTTVDLVHSGFAALRPDHPVRHGEPPEAFLRMIGLWWADLLRSYTARCDRQQE